MSLDTVRAAIWSRPRSRVEWGFAIGLGAMVLAGAAWLLTHSGAEDRESLRQWFAVLSGDTSLKLRTPQFIRGGLMLTAWVWVATALLLWLTRSWWCFSPKSEKQAKGPIDRRFWTALVLIVILAAAIRGPRLGLSLYNDEVDVFRTAIGGTFDPKVLNDPGNPDPATFRTVDWSETVWGNRLGNNHALQSILARAGFDTWRAATGAPDGAIREWPLRLPALFGGLLSIIAVAALARRVVTGTDGGSPESRARGARFGLITAFLLAIHPWHVRYSTEARGYGLVFGFAALAFLFLVLAAAQGKWRWWLAFGASQALCLWACLGSLHLILGLNLTAAVAFLWPRRSADGSRLNPLRSATLQGWIVANLLSAAVFVLMAAPTLPPIEMALKLNATFRSGVAPHWWPDVLGFLLLGMPWLDGDPENSMNPAILKYAATPFVWIALAIAVAAALSGMIRLWRHGGFAGRLLVVAPAFGIVFPWMESSLTKMVLLKWYVSYESLFAVFWMAAGIHGWLLWLGQRTTPGRLRWATYGILGLYAMGVARPLAIYRQQSKQSLRDAVETARGGAFPFTEAQLEPLVAGWWTHANYYDPYFKIAHTPEKLDAMVQRARAEQRPLYFLLGMKTAATRENPAIVDRLEKSGEFEVVKVLPGLEEAQFRTYVYRLRPQN